MWLGSDNTRCPHCKQHLAPAWDNDKRILTVGGRQEYFPPQRARLWNMMWKAGTDFTSAEAMAEITGTTDNVSAHMHKTRKQVKHLGVGIEGKQTHGYRIIRLAEK